MPEPVIAELFGRCIVHAGYREDEEEIVLTWLESFAALARNVHGAE